MASLTVRPITEIFESYVAAAPLALAFERTVEAELYRTVHLERPLLDLGCGEGLFASLVFSEPLDYGIDPNSSELKNATENGGISKLLCCLGDSIPLPESSVACIVSNSVLEHIPDLEPVFQETYRLLTPGGSFFITVPTDMFEHYACSSRFFSLFGRRIDSWWRRKYNAFWRHFHSYPPLRWTEFGITAGFEVVFVREYQPGWMCFINDLLAPFAFPAFLVKKTLNRWFLFPGLRRAIMPKIWKVFLPLCLRATKAEKGGLVFIQFKKPEV